MRRLLRESGALLCTSSPVQHQSCRWSPNSDCSANVEQWWTPELYDRTCMHQIHLSAYQLYSKQIIVNKAERLCKYAKCICLQSWCLLRNSQNFIEWFACIQWGTWIIHDWILNQDILDDRKVSTFRPWQLPLFFDYRQVMKFWLESDCNLKS